MFVQLAETKSHRINICVYARLESKALNISCCVLLSIGRFSLPRLERPRASGFKFYTPTHVFCTPPMSRRPCVRKSNSIDWNLGKRDVVRQMKINA